MNSFRILIAGITILTFASCQSLVFSKKEMDFATNMSALLKGAHVNLSKGVASSTTNGNLKYFEIEIEGLTSDSVHADEDLLLASSMPAYIFYKDTVDDRKSYKYIDVTVKGNGKEYSARYTPDQLQAVHACFAALGGYIGALTRLNSDSLSYYTDTSVTNHSPVAAVIETMKEMDTKWGPVQEQDTKGFKFDTKDGKDILYFHFSLRRGTVSQGVNLWMDPLTKKVVGSQI